MAHLRDWTPEFTADAGLYAFGGDVTFDEDVTISGVWWYHPPGGTAGDVDVTIYTLAQAVLASGQRLAGAIVDGWQTIPLSAPYAAAAGTYTIAAQTAGTHGYGSVSLPITSADGIAHLIQTRYESGGGYPFTEWGSGQHGWDVEYAAGAPVEPSQGELNTGLNLATALTGARTSAGELATGLNLASSIATRRDSSGELATGLSLATALTGSAPHGGTLSAALNLAPALAGARPSQGAVHAGLALAPSLAGARASLGALHAGLNLSPALIGARRSLGALAASLRLQLALTGSDGQAGRAVTPWPTPPEPVAGFPHPSGSVSGFPWPPRPVRSYQEVP
jgi:hypothetical protein